MTSVLADGATQSVYIRQVGGTSQYSTNQSSWSTITWPLTVTNSNGTPASNLLRVLFTTNVTLSSTSDYIEIGSAGIQIGNTSVNANGTRPTITITVNDYPGFVRNGTGSSTGHANVSIYNLVVDGTGYQINTLGAGWVAQGYFGRAAQNNSIVNCSSYGTISDFGGGIVGTSGGSGTFDTPGNLVIRGCSSYGSIGAYGGGIAGNAAGYYGSITCENCWSEGTIGSYAGGIFGNSGGQGPNNSASAVATKCYSLGAISTNGGGIFGERAGENQGSATAQDCYSRGSIGTGAGGIFGSEAGIDSGSTTATNCYSSGSIGGGSAGGVYGTGAYGGATSASCYSANGSWSSSTAQSTLSMTPYISVTTGQPFELRAFGPSPYSLTTVVNNTVPVTFSQTLAAGSSSSAGVLSGVSSYSILSGGHGTISINSTTGALSTTSLTPVGSYTLVVRAVVSSYSITTFVLTVTAAPPTASGRLDTSGKEFNNTAYTRLQEGQRYVLERIETPNLRFTSFAEYTKYLVAQSSFKR